MWMDGAVGVVEGIFGAEMHGYLTFHSHAQAVTAGAVVSVAVSTVAPQLGQLPAAVHYVQCEVRRCLTVYKHDDTTLGGRTEAAPPHAAPLRAEQAPLTKADVQRLAVVLAAVVRQLPPVKIWQVEQPSGATEDSGG